MLRLNCMITCLMIFSITHVASAKIVFVSQRSRQGNLLYVMDDDGSNVRRLTEIPDFPTAESTPDWSPDGMYIVFCRDISKDIKRQQLNLFIIDQDGTNEKQLTETPLFKDGKFVLGDSNCMWSPDGHRIAYCSDVSGSVQIHVIDITTGQILQLTRRNRHVSHPDWSPDGRYIAYTEGYSSIMVITANGKVMKELVVGDKWYRARPQWSADSTSILYTETLQKERGITQSQVVIQNYRSGQKQVLKTPRDWYIRSTCWMDNGKKVLISASGLETPFDIYCYDLKDGRITNLTNNPSADDDMHWISDNAHDVAPLKKQITLWGLLKK